MVRLGMIRASTPSADHMRASVTIGKSSLGWPRFRGVPEDLLRRKINGKKWTEISTGGSPDWPTFDLILSSVGCSSSPVDSSSEDKAIHCSALVRLVIAESAAHDRQYLMTFRLARSSREARSAMATINSWVGGAGFYGGSAGYIHPLRLMPIRLPDRPGPVQVSSPCFVVIAGEATVISQRGRIPWRQHLPFPGCPRKWALPKMTGARVQW